MSALTQKGQVTIPRDIRRFLGLNTGDDVRFLVVNGRVEVQRAVPDHSSFYGLLPVTQPSEKAVDSVDSDLMDVLLEDDDRIRGRSQ